MILGALTVLIPGRPVPKGRPRVGKNGRAHTPERTRAYEAHARAAVHFACIAQKWEAPLGDVSVRIVLTFDTLVHGDVDNHAKAIMDAAQGIAFGDDKRVRSLYVRRDYGPTPSAVLAVDTLPDMAPPPKKPRIKRAAAREERA